MRPIDDAHSGAAVLHWRLGVLGSSPAPRQRGPLASLPPTDGPEMVVARQAGELMRKRWRDLRATLAATTDSLLWAPALGPRPSDPAEESAWLTAATAVTAYRERFEVPEHTLMLGPRLAASRPDARAAWDHACLQADRYLARRLRDLTDEQLADLDTRQQLVLDNPPSFDPSELERVRESQELAARAPRGGKASTGSHHADARVRQLGVLRLEAAAQTHRDWRRTATEAQAIRRQLRIEQQRRRSGSLLRWPTLARRA